MRILFLTHSFNSLAQRLFIELSERGHEISVELDVNDAVSIEAVELFRPDLIVAPFLKRRIPERIWRHHLCLVVHPGPIGDRGPSALDWAILRGEQRWGVTCLQADAELDAGPVWASAGFAMRQAAKSSLYRREVTEAAARTVLEAVERIETGGDRPRSTIAKGTWRSLVRHADRAIDWASDDGATVLAKIRAADGQPGVADELFGEPCQLYDAHPEAGLRGDPGAVIARRDGALCRATVDGAVWIGHVKRSPPAGERGFKLPAAMAFRDQIADLPNRSLAPEEPLDHATWREIIYEERGPVGHLSFAFYNGAMSVAQCRRLLRAYEHACSRPTRVIVLWGGPEFWSNGMSLNVIEAAASPAEESWRNINAIDDLARAIIETEGKLTIAALQGNAGAGGVFLALAADRVIARAGVVLNPHYKNMGNLFGSEYWTYLLPKRIGAEPAAALMAARLPLGAAAASRIGLIDQVIGGDHASFRRAVDGIAKDLAGEPGWAQWLAEKRTRRAADEAVKPLEHYRSDELARMRLNFFGFDPSYHVARYNFVTKVPHARTPLYLARHRRR